MRKCLLVQPINNIGIDEITGGSNSEGPGTRQCGCVGGWCEREDTRIV